MARVSTYLGRRSSGHGPPGSDHMLCGSTPMPTTSCAIVPRPASGPHASSRAEAGARTFAVHMLFVVSLPYRSLGTRKWALIPLARFMPAGDVTVLSVERDDLLVVNPPWNQYLSKNIETQQNSRSEWVFAQFALHCSKHSKTLLGGSFVPEFVPALQRALVGMVNGARMLKGILSCRDDRLGDPPPTQQPILSG